MDPVFVDGSGWWFWDETWANRIGPYASRKKTETAMRDYLAWLGRPPRNLALISE